MLRAIGVRSIDDLFSDIPEDIKLRRSLRVGFGKPLSEIEVQKLVDSMLSKNKVFKDPPPFLGGGVWPHYVPAAVKEIVRRAEFYTSYTPYQAEASQGLLQALFEYQSLMADLLEMDVVNASMYDWSTALAEAALMAHRVTSRRKIIVPRTMNPFHYEVLRTVAGGRGLKLETVGYNAEEGVVDLEELKGKIDDNTAAVYIENPSFLGFVERNAKAVGEVAHDKGALFIVGVDPISLGVLVPPGRYGADVVVGEGQPLGLGLNYGGPLLGIFAVRWNRKLVRQMPGKLIGLTTTVDGKERCFAMILQTREQHIRRERATSNITTNEALMAVAAAAYLALLGPKGLRKLGELIAYRCNYAIRRLSKVPGVKVPLFPKAKYFKEFPASFSKPYEEVHEHLLRNGVHGGLPLKKFFPEFGDSALFCVTELHTKEHIDLLAKLIEEVMK